MVYAALVGALTLAEFKEARFAQRVLKPAAALGIILIALLIGVPESNYEILIFLGLIACAFGDIFLLSRHSHKLFLAGMGAFALGHFAYLTAFVSISKGVPTGIDTIKSIVTIFAGLGVYSWLKPHLPSAMKIPVRIYFLIILIMVINALRLPSQGPLLLAMMGAVLFAISDVFVGRDRFVMPTPKNTLATTPL